MPRLPQIRLRTLFFLIFCAAVGLAIGASPKDNSAPTLTIFGWKNAELNWHYALLSAASVAVIAGLFKEIAQLRKWQPLDGADGRSLLFAKKFAVLWRGAVCGLLIVCLITALLIAQRVVKLPETETRFSYELFPYAAWVVCLIVVLSVSVVRLKRPNFANGKPRRETALWIAGVLLAALILLDVLLVHSLVHIATAGIEYAQPLTHQRQEAFPNHRAEGFRTFWLSAAAMGCVVLSAASLMYLNRRRILTLSKKVSGYVVFGVSLLIASAFVVWYYAFEFQRVSPDLASVGVGSNPVEWLAGFILAATVTTVGAYRLTVSDRRTVSIPINIGNENNRRSTYESAGCLLLLAGAVVIYVGAVLRTYLTLTRGWFWSPQTAEVLVGMVREPSVMLLLAVLLVSAQIALIRWRRRHEPTEWFIAALEPQRFVWNWIALAALVCVSIPTIAAFLFLFWCGPWYLYGP
jgi:hypothetical protein